MKSDREIYALDTGSTYAPCPPDYRPPDKPTPNPTGPECICARCEWRERLIKGLSTIGSLSTEIEELSRDRKDAKRLAERWPGKRIAQIAAKSEKQYWEATFEWQRKMREAGLL